MRPLLLAVALAVSPQQAAPPPHLRAALAASVMVNAGDSSGSGVLVKNGDTTFVWTNAHVVADCQNVRYHAPTAPGLPAWASVRYADVWAVVHDVEGGRKVGEEWRLAEVVRFSREHDLAVLRVYKKGWGAGAARFADREPAAGDEVWHVGSQAGAPGHNSVSQGVVAAVGRLRRGGQPNERHAPQVYDQASLSAFQGSSGGGVFGKADGRCLGLVSEYLLAPGGTQTHGSMCLVPARRIRAFAKQYDCEWALGPAAPVPAAWGAVTCDPVPPAPEPVVIPVPAPAAPESPPE